MLGLADEVLEQLRPYCARAQGAGLGALAGAGQAGPHTMRFTNHAARERPAPPCTRRQTARARLLRAQRTPERQPLVCSWRLEVL
jgi:hypothetical protein